MSHGARLCCMRKCRGIVALMLLLARAESEVPARVLCEGAASRPVYIDISRRCRSLSPFHFPLIVTLFFRFSFFRRPPPPYDHIPQMFVTSFSSYKIGV